jgi:hypothetical protein
MKQIKMYEEFVNEELFIDELFGKIIETLHEGVRMIEVSVINEGSVDRAQYELDRLIKSSNGTPIIAEFIPEVMSLVKKFADSGQSGGSAPYTTAVILQVLEKLLKQQPLGGITCEADEWSDCSVFEDAEEGTGTFQNKRLSSVFKVGKEGTPYYLDAIVFKAIGKDYTFTSGGSVTNEETGEVICSSQYIKSLPFEPKTFVIDVNETEYRKNKDGSLVPEEGGGWWESKIADPKQLEAVWEYYNKKPKRK